MTKRFCHSGDMGDILSSLVAVRQLGGGEYILCPHPHRGGGPRVPMTLARANFLLPLLRAQPYITSARFEEKPQGITHDFTDIRMKTQKADDRESLADWHAHHVGIMGELDTSPWLSCRPSGSSVGKTVFSRSLRYNNPDFPWVRLLFRSAGNNLFVGLAEEHHKLITPSKQARTNLPRAQCEDALQMASIIAGAKAFVGNQSFPLWVALGLGKECVVACWRPSPDVRLPRANVTYFFDRRTNADFYRSL